MNYVVVHCSSVVYHFLCRLQRWVQHEHHIVPCGIPKVRNVLKSIAYVICVPRITYNAWSGNQLCSCFIFTYIFLWWAVCVRTHIVYHSWHSKIIAYWHSFYVSIFMSCLVPDFSFLFYSFHQFHPMDRPDMFAAHWQTINTALASTSISHSVNVISSPIWPNGTASAQVILFFVAFGVGAHPFSLSQSIAHTPLYYARFHLCSDTFQFFCPSIV